MISHNHPPAFRPVPPPTDARDSWRALSGAWTPNRIAGRWMCTARGDAADGVIRPPRSRRTDLGVGLSIRLLAVIEGVMKFLTSLGVLLRENMSCAPAPNNPPLSRDWPGDACRDGCRFAAEKFGENAPDGPDDENAARAMWSWAGRSALCADAKDDLRRTHHVWRSARDRGDHVAAASWLDIVAISRSWPRQEVRPGKEDTWRCPACLSSLSN